MPHAALFSELRAAAGELWPRAQDHPFVHALGDGSLPRASFAHFLAQDYVYLVGFSRATALACAKAPDLFRLTGFAAMLNETLTSEMELHREYCASFGISAEALAATEAAPSCRAYSDFCIATAALGDVTELLAALLPCAVGYSEIGARLAPRLAGWPQHPYRRWIETYSGEAYQQYARLMIGVLDDLGAGVPERRKPRLTELFNLGCRYEWLFWEMAWTLQRWPL